MLEYVQEITVGDAERGLLGLYTDDNNDQRVRLQISLLDATFATTVDSFDGQNNITTEKLLMHLQDLLGTKKPSRNLEVERTTLDTLTLRVKERLPSGMVRLLWNQTLTQQQQTNTTDCTGSTILAMSLDLLQLHTKQTRQREQLVVNQHQLVLDRNDWKDTAQKLERQWETEKTQLFHNFCTLYEQSKEHFTSKIKDLNEHIEMLQEEKKQAATAARPRPAPLPQVLRDVPNDDRDEWDPELVQKLAAGQKVTAAPAAKKKRRAPAPKKPPPSKRAATIKQKKPATKAAAAPQSKAPLADRSESAASKNPPDKPNTAQSGEPTKKESTAKPAPKKTNVLTLEQRRKLAKWAASSSDSSSDDDFAAAPKRVGRASTTTQPSATTQPSTPNSATSDGESDQNSIDAQIMADIEALQAKN